MPAPPPAATPAPSGPCKAAAVSSIAVRPGIGRAPATSGAVCVAAPGAIVIGFGYRDQVTAGAGRQYLTVAPEPVALIGVARRIELIAAPGLAYSNRTGGSGSSLQPGSGQQDAGFGAQILIGDQPSVQQAVSFYETVPTGYPVGTSGFSSGFPSSALAYTIAVNLGGGFGLSTSQGITVASGFDPAAALRRFTAFSPTLNLSYAASPPTTLLLEDQLSAPTAPGGPTGNRALLAVQQTLSPDTILDAEFELNALPQPGFHQHAFGAGITFRR
jgi:hypothetical protein